MRRFLIDNLNISEMRLRYYSSIQGFHDAMCKGSKNGGIDAIFDELPYMKLLLNRYESQYKIVGPTYRTDGFGFVSIAKYCITFPFKFCILIIFLQLYEQMSISRLFRLNLP